MKRRGIVVALEVHTRLGHVDAQNLPAKWTNVLRADEADFEIL